MSTIMQWAKASNVRAAPFLTYQPSYDETRISNYVSQYVNQLRFFP